MKGSLHKIFLASLFSLLILPVRGQHTHFQSGDIFLGQGTGFIQWRDSVGVLIRNIITGDGSGNGNGTGLRINPVTGKLWVTNSNLPPNSPNGIRIINTDGTPGNTIDVSAYQGNPTSITFDKQGNGYIGDLWSPVIVKINAAGSSILDHYTISTDSFVWGPEWVEMDCNDSIIYYTNLRERVKRYNVVTRQQLPDFADLTGIPTWLFAMRLLSGKGMIVASADNRVLRLNTEGSFVRDYKSSAPCGYFGMAATPDGESFWAGGLAFYGPMYKFDIGSGRVIDSFFASTNQGVNIHGIAIYGDKLNNCRENFPPQGPVKIKIFPNPTTGNFTLQTDLSGPLRIDLYSTSGQLVFSKVIYSGNGTNTIPLNTGKLLPGYYHLRLSGDLETRFQKILIR